MVKLFGARSEGDVLSCGKEEMSLTVKDYLRAEEMEERGACGVGETAIVQERAGIGGDGKEDLTTFQCVTPGKIVAGWFRKLRGKKAGTARTKRCEVDGEGKMQADCSTKCSREKPLTSSGVVEVAETPKKSEVSGQEEQITSLKLGAGLGLALVVAASKNELDKMLELRKQMEMIVENAKEELRCKAAICNSSQSYENPTCSTTNIDESMNSNGRVSDPSCTGTPSSHYIELDIKESPFHEIGGEEWCRGECKEERCVFNGIAQLESELEAELQLLELHLDSEDMSRDTQLFIQQDLAQESSVGGCEETLSTYEEENHANDPINTFTDAHYNGVPPQELERRLHELLEAQQLDRIIELEAALRLTKQKLRKKEVEVCWWKDTAHLVSQHVSKTAPLYIPSQKDQPHENIR